MGIELDFYEIVKMELCEHECDAHSLTQTATLKGGWFGLTGGDAKSRLTWFPFCSFETWVHDSHVPTLGGLRVALL